MELNEWDYKQLKNIAKILRRDNYPITARTMEMIIRKLKRADRDDLHR